MFVNRAMDGEGVEIVEQREMTAAQRFRLLLAARAGHVLVLLQKECPPIAIAVQPQLAARVDQLLHRLRVLRRIRALLLFLRLVRPQHVVSAVDARQRRNLANPYADEPREGRLQLTHGSPALAYRY
jgi:hypothetical protein